LPFEYDREVVSIGRSVVLSSGGPPGAAWMVGMLDRLSGYGVELSQADLIVGTSAGALAGAPLAGGVLDRAVAIYGGAEIPPFRAPATFEEFMMAATRVAADAADPQEAVRRTANLDPLGSSFVSEEEAASLFGALLPLTGWPRKRLVVTASDADSGLRVVFDVDSGVRLIDAVRARPSCPLEVGRLSHVFRS
jgi:NTE family protein